MKKITLFLAFLSLMCVAKGRRQPGYFTVRQLHFWDPWQWYKMCFEFQRFKFQWKNFTPAYGQGGASLTVKYPFFYASPKCYIINIYMYFIQQNICFPCCLVLCLASLYLLASVLPHTPQGWTNPVKCLSSMCGLMSFILFSFPHTLQNIVCNMK